MGTPQYTKHESVGIRSLGYDEPWLELRIKEDPSILGLGRLRVKAQQLRQQNAGRLDLLLTDEKGEYLYVVELMLGKLDESHIIRAIEYWDLAKRDLNFRDYEHIAVIVAEDITSRFFNVITLFARTIPIIALQLSAIVIGNVFTLHFTRVLDLSEAPTEESPGAGPPVRPEELPETIRKTVDECFELLRGVVPNAQPTYRQKFIGVSLNGLPNNFVTLHPKREWVRLKARVADRESWMTRIENAGLELLRGGDDEGSVRFRLKLPDVAKSATLLKALFEASYKYWSA